MKLNKLCLPIFEKVIFFCFLIFILLSWANAEESGRIVPPGEQRDQSLQPTIPPPVSPEQNPQSNPSSPTEGSENKPETVQPSTEREQKEPPPAPPAPEPKSETQTPPPVLFSLIGFQVEGNTLFPKEKVDSILSPFTGDKKGFTDIENARIELEKAYHDAGYPTVLAIIPEQTLENGVVKLEVVESRLKKIEITGNRYFSRHYILKRLPSLKIGTIPYQPDVEKELGLLNQKPDLAVIPVLSPGEEKGDVDLQLNVQDRIPLHGSLEWNNKQTPNTPLYRLEAMAQYANLFEKDQILSFNTTQTPEDFGKVAVYGLNYSIPLSGPKDSLLLYSTYSESGSAIRGVNLLGFAGDISFKGSNTILGVKRIFSLESGGSWSQQLFAGIEYKQIGPTTADFPEPLGPLLVANPVNYTPVTLGYAASKIGTFGTYNVTLTAKGNHSGILPWGGKEFFGGAGPSQAETMPGNRLGSTGNFAILQAGSEFYKNLPKQMAISIKMNGQIASEPLISAEEFYLGGVDSVRGYLESEIPGDDGIRGSLEYFFPPFTQFLQGSETDLLRMRGYLDGGGLFIKQAPPGQADHYSIASYGLAIDLKMGDRFLTTLNEAWTLDDGIATKKHNSLFLFSVKLQF